MNQLVSIEAWLSALATLVRPTWLTVQERFYEWHWEMHPTWWWGWGIGMMVLVFLFWVIFFVGLIVGIRWLFGRGERPPDSAMEILRQRYARGEINKEEFEARKKDLS